MQFFNLVLEVLWLPVSEKVKQCLREACKVLSDANSVNLGLATAARPLWWQSCSSEDDLQTWSTVSESSRTCWRIVPNGFNSPGAGLCSSPCSCPVWALLNGVKSIFLFLSYTASALLIIWFSWRNCQLALWRRLRCLVAPADDLLWLHCLCDMLLL